MDSSQSLPNAGRLDNACKLCRKAWDRMVQHRRHTFARGRDVRAHEEGREGRSSARRTVQCVRRDTFCFPVVSTDGSKTSCFLSYGRCCYHTFQGVQRAADELLPTSISQRVGRCTVRRTGCSTDRFRRDSLNDTTMQTSRITNIAPQVRRQSNRKRFITMGRKHFVHYGHPKGKKTSKT